MAVTYIVKAVASKKWREIDTLLLQPYLFVPFPMTLSDLEGSFA